MKIAGWKLALFVLSVCQAQDIHAESIPRVAYTYRSQLIREARHAFGLTAPSSTFASQIHTESGYRANICNRIGACGLGQIMPRTARGLAKTYPELGPAAPLNPQWALRAMLRYNLENWGHLRALHDQPCLRMKMTLASYNAGPGVLKRKRWPKETQRYVARIMALEPTYIAANFGLGSCNL